MPHPPRLLSNFARLALVLLSQGLLFADAAAVYAADAPEAVVQPLLSMPLPDIPGKEVILLTVSYLPGGASLPHRHDADVFVYVLEGTLRMQVAGQAPVILHPGQIFHESPSDVHSVSENFSHTEGARFLVFMVKDAGRPATRSVDVAPANIH